MTDSLVEKCSPARGGASRRGDASVRSRWFAKAVFGFDERFRRWHQVFEYSDHPDCIFRMRIVCSDHAVVFRDRTVIRPGERIIELHLWNEQVPAFPTEGASIAWARRMSRALGLSLCELTSYLGRRPDLADINAIRADLIFGTAKQDAQLARVAGRFGFEIFNNLPLRQPALSRAKRLGENILISLFVLARNPRALRADTLFRSRTEAFLTRGRLDRHGSSQQQPR